MRTIDFQPRRSALRLALTLGFWGILGGSSILWAQEEAPEPGAAEGDETVVPASLVQESLRQWVEVKKLASEELAEWEAEKNSLADLNELRKREIASLDEIIEAAGSRLTDAEQQRESLLAEEDALKAKRARLEDAVVAAEAQLRPLVRRFPPPLMTKVDEVVARLEAADPEATLQNRFRDVLLILQEVTSFDRSITVDAELMDLDGKQVSVDVLYLGLSRAWFVDQEGGRAGTGLPGDEGWVWTTDNAMASEVGRAIAIYRKESPPAYTNLTFPEVSTGGPSE